MATFAGRTSPAALAALAPSITNLAAAQRAKSQAAAGLMNTLGVQFEKQKEQEARKQKNQAAQQVAEGLLKDEAFRRQVPGISTSADLVKLVGAENVIEYGMKSQQADRLAQQSAAQIALTRKQIEQYDRQQEDRELQRRSDKNTQVLLSEIMGLGPGGDTSAIVEKIAGSELSSADRNTLFNTLENKTGLPAQAAQIQYETAKRGFEQAGIGIASRKRASQAISEIQKGNINKENLFDAVSGLSLEDQKTVLDEYRRANPEAPQAQSITDAEGKIIGYAVDIGNNNIRVLEVGDKDKMDPTTSYRLAALRQMVELNPDRFTPEQISGMEEQILQQGIGGYDRYGDPMMSTTTTGGDAGGGIVISPETNDIWSSLDLEKSGYIKGGIITDSYKQYLTQLENNRVLSPQQVNEMMSLANREAAKQRREMAKRGEFLSGPSPMLPGQREADRVQTIEDGEKPVKGLTAMESYEIGRARRDKNNNIRMLEDAISARKARKQRFELSPEEIKKIDKEIQDFRARLDKLR